MRGHARLQGVGRVHVRRGDGTVEVLQANRAVVIATGSRAALPPVPGLADVRPWDNRDVTSVRAVPRRLLVVDGGAVGLEMAQAVKRLGADEVGMIEAAPSLLVREEPFAGQHVRAALESEGIEVAVSTRLASARRDGAGHRLLANVPLSGRPFRAENGRVAVW